MPIPEPEPYRKGDLLIPNDLGIVVIDEDTSAEADFVQGTTVDGSDTYDPIMLRLSHRRVTPEMVAGLRALGFEVEEADS
jgi:hypothetical protein